MKMLRQDHTSCLVLGLLMLVVHPAYVQADEEIVDVTSGVHYFRSKNPGTACTLTLPNNTKCHDNNVPGEICITSSSGGYCYFQVNIISKEQSGVYRLEYTETGATTAVTDTYYVYLRTGVVPPNTINVLEEENMYVRLEDSFGTDTGRKCEITYPNKTTVNLLDPSVKPLHFWGREDECGFKVEKVSRSEGGDWKIRMSSSGGNYTYADFWVTVIPLVSIDLADRPPVEWFIGEEGTLHLPATYGVECELWNPRQEMVAAPCSYYTQKIVTEADNGSWIYVLRTEGKISEDTIVQEVIVKKREWKVNVSKSERIDGGTSLLCSLNSVAVKDCRFTRPDGAVIFSNEGIGNANYSYFGNGFDKGDCGLTIHEVKEQDKGLWNCTVSYRSLLQRSGFLNVSSTLPDVKIRANEARVAVRQNTYPPQVTELYLSCSPNRTLEYCWFRHPSGLPLHFSTEDVYLDRTVRWYVYSKTLELGVCGITVTVANSSFDSGEWKCNLGFLDSPEEEYAESITVGISETDVVSFDKEVDDSDGLPVLKCYSVPLGVPLEYCRFIRPDGRGFKVEPNSKVTVLDRYQYEADGLAKGECGLRFVSDINEDEDVGKWTCVARLQGKNREGQDFINVTTAEGLSTGAIVGIVLGAVVLLLVIVGVSFLIIRRRK